jgi:hypothetical protein
MEEMYEWRGFYRRVNFDQKKAVGVQKLLDQIVPYRHEGAPSWDNGIFSGKDIGPRLKEIL